MASVDAEETLDKMTRMLIGPKASNQDFARARLLVRKAVTDVESADINLAAEHERLRSAVVEAAQKWRTEMRRINATTLTSESKITAVFDAIPLLIEAVDALNAWEAEYLVEQKDGK